MPPVTSLGPTFVPNHEQQERIVGHVGCGAELYSQKEGGVYSCTNPRSVSLWKEPFRVAVRGTASVYSAALVAATPVTVTVTATATVIQEITLLLPSRANNTNTD